MSPRALVWLLMTVATGFAAVNVGAGALYLVALALFVFGLVAFGSAWRARSALAFRPDLPARAMAGAEVPVSLELLALREAGPLLSLASDPGSTWRRRWLPRLLPAAPALPSLARGERAQVILTCVWPRRGRHPMPRRVLQAPAWGLGGWLHPVELAGTVVVYPRVESLGRMVRAPGRGTGERLADALPQLASVTLVESDLVRGVRPYRTGDSPRMVHARATARTGEIRVRELEQQTPHGAGGWRVVLDGGLSDEAFERSLEILASLVTWLNSSGRGLEVWTPHHLSWSTGKGLEERLDALADAVRLEAPPTSPESWPWTPTAVLTTRPLLAGAGLWLHVGEDPCPVGALPCGRGRALAEGLHGHLG